MKKIVLISMFGLIGAAPLLADDTNVLADDKARLSYAIGVTFANRWKEQGVDVDPDIVLRGLKDAQAGKPLLMSPQDMSTLMNKVQQEIADRARQKLAQVKAEGEAFLAANKAKPGVVTLPDGLQYKILAEGNGAVPVDGDTVTVNYRGTFVDGGQFASGNAAQIPVGTNAISGRNAISGFNEALKLMKTGSKWQVVIPPQLAYGAMGYGPIPPDSTLILDVELLSIQQPNNPPPQPPPQPAAASQPLTSDIIAVPSAEDLKKGKQPYTIKAEDLPEIQRELQHTN
jgi:FKBP-type peptidyl-prolyl cis-trans isomerase FklB